MNSNATNHYINTLTQYDLNPSNTHKRPKIDVKKPCDTRSVSLNGAHWLLLYGQDNSYKSNANLLFCRHEQQRIGFQKVKSTIAVFLFKYENKQTRSIWYNEGKDHTWDHDECYKITHSKFLITEQSITTNSVTIASLAINILCPQQDLQSIITLHYVNSRHNSQSLMSFYDRITIFQFCCDPNFSVTAKWVLCHPPVKKL